MIWKQNTRKDQQLFGANDNPVDVKDGTIYSFQARSKKEQNPSKRGGWSPPPQVTVGA